MTQYDSPATFAETIPPRQSRARWPLLAVLPIDLIIIIVLVFAGSIALFAALFVVRGFTLDDLANLQSDPEALGRLLGSSGLMLSLLIQNAVCALIPILRVGWLRGEPLASIGLQAPRPLRLVGIGVAMGFAALAVNVISGAIFQWFGIQPDQSEQLQQLGGIRRGEYLAQIALAIGAVILAPIGEEILFRGYVFNAIAQSGKSSQLAVALAFIGSAALFSIVHISGVTTGASGLLVPIFLVGLVFAWGVYYTRSVVPGIIAHAINNGVAIMALLISVNTDLFPTT